MLSSKICEMLANFFHIHFVLKVEVSGEVDRTFDDIKNYLLISKLLSGGKAVVVTTKNFESLMVTARLQILNLKPQAADAGQNLAEAQRLYNAIPQCSRSPTCTQLLVRSF